MDVLCEQLIDRHLGPYYSGRRYLRFRELQQLGIVTNRATLKLWIDSGAFPAGIKLAGPRGKTLLWRADEVARVIAERTAERESSKLQSAAPE
jgi:predicted DNA-binding transcriptional regulator AlpA